MTTEAAIDIILRASSYFREHNAGYQSWGEVNVLQIALRTDNGTIVSSPANQSLEELSREAIQSNSPHPYFQPIFSKRKKIGAILLTQQRFASKVTREIPPILDDQAQLLGVSVRMARSEADIFRALRGRFAAILPDGNSLCLGSNIEEAFVAAQLLEKSSKAFIEAEVLGGAKSINKFEAWLMQKFYQLKYSREAKKNK